MSREELEESIDWHAEEHIPYDLADVSLDYQVTAKLRIQHMSDSCLQTRTHRQYPSGDPARRKTPVVIDVDTFALQNCYEVNYNPTENRRRNPAQYRSFDDERQYRQRYAVAVYP